MPYQDDIADSCSEMMLQLGDVYDIDKVSRYELPCLLYVFAARLLVLNSTALILPTDKAKGKSPLWLAKWSSGC